VVDNVVAASIAHEVRQPLTAIIMSAAAGFRFLDNSPPDLAQAKEAFKRIVADGHRAGAVVEDIRANFRSDPGTSNTLDVNELIEEAVALELGELERHQVRVEVEANMQLPAVRGRRFQLQQVLFNLIANAIDAMTEVGAPRVLQLRSSAYSDDQVLVAVADSGTGISSCVRNRIFDPMFTTKADGMGMGLAICRAIIEAHGGRLWAAANTPTGTIFQFTLKVNTLLPVEQVVP
jgi:C4-dicarboxylate-specific signal transduction histidine kinase